MDILNFGSKGNEVKKLTQLLMGKGFLKLVSDDFDDTVEEAVKAFQASHTDTRDHKLDADGIVGPLTWWALEQAVQPVVTAPSRPTSTVLPTVPAATPKFGELVLQFALDEMKAGAREIGGDNEGPFVVKYLNGLSAPGVSWCSAFVSYCHKKAAEKLGVPMPYTYDLGAKSTYAQFKAKGWTYNASHNNPPEPGDIIVFWRGDPNGWQGHIGIVEKYNAGIVFSVEGNVGPFSSHVRGFSYVLGDIARLWGFGRVKI